MASRFEQRHVAVRDIEFEILLHPGHLNNLNLFAESADKIARRIEETISWSEEINLRYPYDGLSLVDVPNRLRGYKGGWRMDTALSLSGMQLIKENSFPTARFENEFKDADRFEDTEGGIAAAKVATLERFFENDFNGGNIFTGAANNILKFQTNATGEGAFGINFVLAELVNDAITGKRGYFSAHEFNQQINMLIGKTVTDMAVRQSDSVIDSFTRAVTDRPSVWNRALSTSLADLNPVEYPSETINVLKLKGGAIARSIQQALGKHESAELLSKL